MAAELRRRQLDGLVFDTHSSLEIETSEENANDFWRLLVNITGIQG